LCDLSGKTIHIKRFNGISNLILIVVLALSWQPVTLALAKSALGAQNAAQLLPVETLLNSDGTLNTRTGASGGLDLRGWNVSLDSVRGLILTHDTSAPAAPTADSWAAFVNHGLNNTVLTLAVMGSDPYVGSGFTQATDGTVTNLNNIARHSGGAWSALAHPGLNGSVQALAVMGSDLYVGTNSPRPPMGR
jgi:hypothetical protein